MQTNKVSYRVIDGYGWTGYKTIEDIIDIRRKMADRDIKRILKITEEELDAEEVEKIREQIKVVE